MEARRGIEAGTDRMVAVVDDGVGWMTYNNPARHNALSSDMVAAVPAILRAFQGDPDVAVIVVTGAGDKAFVSGADISEFGERRTTVEARAAYDRAMSASWRAWEEVDKPIIAMIRGYCIGGGLLTALRADIRVCAEGSQFGVPAARLGLGYAFGGVQQLVDLVGPAWTAEILFSGRRLSAAEALRIGLVNRVVPAEDLEAQVADLATSIAANAPLTVRACKFSIRQARTDPERRDMARVDELVEACFQSEDYLEGQRAFAEKRTPRFRGR
jgi:enoyl-CoA hydratase/carnithine racemase